MLPRGIISLGFAVLAAFFILNVLVALLVPRRRRDDNNNGMRALAQRHRPTTAPLTSSNLARGVAPGDGSDATLPLPIRIEDGHLPSPLVSAPPSACSSFGDILPSARGGAYIVPPGATFVRTRPADASHGERDCAQICCDLFPDAEVLYNYRDKTLTPNPDTGAALELDIFYPALRFAVEFNGAQHYGDSSHWGTRAASQMAKDQIKAARCVAAGICLVTIPHTYTAMELKQKTIRAAAAAHGLALSGTYGDIMAAAAPALGRPRAPTRAGHELFGGLGL
jgi:hypothetical protein